MKQLYILILNLFFYLSKFINIFYFLYYDFIILKIIDTWLRLNIVHINYGTYGGHAYIIETPFSSSPPLIGTGIGESPN